jgi:PAS domain S-box-containing protein
MDLNSQFPVPSQHLPGKPHLWHSVLFYKQESVLLEELSRLVRKSLMAGNAAIVVATQAHREDLAKRLEASGFATVGATEQGRYVVMDAAETLSKFMVNEELDAGLFHALTGEIILQAKLAAGGEYLPVFVFGEMVTLLWTEGRVEAAIQLEQLWNEMAKSRSFSLLCAYPMNIFCREEHAEPFARICAAHTLVIPSDGYDSLENDELRPRGIAQLQQKAEVLDAKVSLRESEVRFHRLVEAVRDYAIFMLDTDGRIISWNSGAQHIKGYKASEIIGKHFSIFYSEEDLQDRKPQRELEIAAREGRLEDNGWRFRKDGSKFWANVIISAVREDDGRLVGFTKVTRDTTERMLVLKELEESRRELRESESALRRLSLHLLRSQEEERRRIGRDLHDSLGQTLSVLKMKLDSFAGSNCSGEIDPRNQDIADCALLTEECLKEVRTIAYLLYPPMLEEMGLKSAIAWYLDGFAKRSGIATTFDISANFGRLHRDVETALFRVLQESMTNVHRHSGSQTVHVRLISENGATILEVSDKGKGMPSPPNSQKSGSDGIYALGVGLRSMAERMHQLGGEIKFTSSSEGTTVIASVPLEMSAAAAANSGL